MANAELEHERKKLQEEKRLVQEQIQNTKDRRNSMVKKTVGAAQTLEKYLKTKNDSTKIERKIGQNIQQALSKLDIPRNK